MAGATAKERLKELKDTARDWFSKERQRLTNEYEFLDAISKKRGGGDSIQEDNASSASALLVNSINEYLGTPLSPSGG